MTIEIKEYKTPEFLLTETTDTIYNRMTEVDIGEGRKAKDVLDVSQGSMFWDACRPSAIEKARLVQFQLNEAIKAGFPQYALDEDLDMHGAAEGIPRKEAAPAKVILTVTGTQGTFIPAQFRFATPTIGDVPGVEFATDIDAIIPESGTIDIPATAVEAGISGNVPAGTISLQSQPKEGISSVNNAAKAEGGADIESNEDYRQRILEAKQRKPGSGSKFDYIKWAKEVSGVGDADAIPEWMGPGTGTVKVLVVDDNGDPANEVILQRVREHITGPNGDDGLAPNGAIVTVAAPVALCIYYYATIMLAPATDIVSVIAELKGALLQYYPRARAEKVLRYNWVTALITSISGVIDYQSVVLRIQDTVESYNPGTSSMVLVKGYPNLQAGDLIQIDGIDYIILSYTPQTKTVQITNGPASIVDNNVLIQLGTGQQNITLSMEWYPQTGNVVVTTA